MGERTIPSLTVQASTVATVRKLHRTIFRIRPIAPRPVARGTLSTRRSGPISTLNCDPTKGDSNGHDTHIRFQRKVCPAHSGHEAGRLLSHVRPAGADRRRIPVGLVAPF